METQTSKQVAGTHRGTNFSASEDETLCKAWLTTEKDLVALETNISYWDRIVDTFNQLMGKETTRTTTSLMSRWFVIQRSVSKFCGFLDQLEKGDEKGLTELDRIIKAKRAYHLAQGHPFKFESCWNLLKGAARWEEFWSARVNTKKAKPNVDIDVNAIGLGASPTSPPSTPSTPSSVPIVSDIDPISLYDPSKERIIRRKLEKERMTEDSNPYTVKVHEANMVLKTFLSDFNARLQKSEEIALRELQMKEQTMLERKHEKEQQIMDMDLNGMPTIRRDYYLARQKEILARWNLSAQGSTDGHSGLQSEGNSGGQSREGTL
ncbi:hypothetical protein ACHQM5_006430 [Ranunculus cassubicifolius]